MNCQNRGCKDYDETMTDCCARGEPPDVAGCPRNYQWHTLPKWKKRLHGWLCYQMQSWGALLFPEAADRIMYKVLREQFEEPNKEVDRDE